MNLSSRPKAVVLLNNIVPYHDARWRGAAALFSHCVVVEMTNRDEFRALEVAQKSQGNYERVTLFPNADQTEISAGNLTRKVRGVLELENPTVIFVNGYSFFYNWIALEWGLRHQVPVVICSESNEHDEPRSAWKEWVKRFFVSRCAAGLAGGTPQATYLEKLGLPLEYLFTGYDAVDNEYFERGSTQARNNEPLLREQWGLPQRYFFSCARFGKKKNIPGLIKAYAAYLRKISESSILNPEALVCDLVIAGDGEEREVLEKMIVDLQLSEHVHLIGPQSYEELPGYYALAEAFIHASTTEQWGLVVNEAMACGLPVLVSERCGCAADLVLAGVNGWIFDPADQSELATLMLKIASDASLRNAMGAKSREMIANWGPARFAEGVACALAADYSAPSKQLHVWDRLVFTLMALRYLPR
jgi:1,2-diacylglycerol 3-alpha-glucosyltransferase